MSSAELTLRGTYDRPQLFGRAEIERGEVFFEGKRYNVRRGVVDFSALGEKGRMYTEAEV